MDDLGMEGNSGLVLYVSSIWIPPFQFHRLRMDSCNLGPSFTTWLKFQKNLFDLDMSNASISGSVPNWFWNNIYSQLDPSNNKLSCSTTPNIGESNLNLAFLYISSNKITREIPKSIRYMRNLIIIDLSRNSFTGSIPSSNKSLLCSLNLGHNNLSREIPWLVRKVSIALLKQEQAFRGASFVFPKPVKFVDS